MAKTETLVTIKFDTLGDLLDELAKIAKDKSLWDVLSAAVDSESGDTFTQFTIVQRTLSDKSKVMDFELSGGE